MVETSIYRVISFLSLGLFAVWWDSFPLMNQIGAVTFDVVVLIGAYLLPE